MFRVIDTIRLDRAMLRDFPKLAGRFDRGLLVILDPAQVTSPPFSPGVNVRVHRPDGSSFLRSVAEVECPHSVVGLFFNDTEQHEVPRDSQIELATA
jgi:hypothetical protein